MRAPRSSQLTNDLLVAALTSQLFAQASMATQEVTTTPTEPRSANRENSEATTRFTDEFIQALPVAAEFYENVLTLAPELVRAMPVRDPSVEPEDDEKEDWRNMNEALEILRSGNREESLRVALDAEELFSPFFAEPEDRRDDLKRAVRSLRAYFAIERDEWTLDRLALGLAEQMSENLEPLFAELLDHTSPNARHRAVTHFIDAGAGTALPRLTQLWKREDRPWILADLIEVLDDADLGLYAVRCLELMDSDDPMLAAAAIGAVGYYEPPGALAALMQRAQSGPLELRAAAFEAIGALEDPDEGLNVVLDAVRSTDADIQLAAVISLSGFGDQARQELIDLSLSSTVSPTVRTFALRGLERLAPHEAAGLRDVISTELRLSADEERRARTAVRDGEPRFEILAPKGMASLRCGAEPGLDKGASGRRLPAGLRAGIEDHFEDDSGGVWLEVEVEKNRRCWVPHEAVQWQHEPDQSESGVSSPVQNLVEFDAPAVELQSEIARLLIEAGLLRIIEDGEISVGLALDVDAADQSAVNALASSVPSGDTQVAQEVRSLLRGLVGLYPGDSELGSAVRTALDGLE